MALYGTYRPKDFSTLVGQETAKTTLSQASASNRISHAYLFCGSRGTGKTSSARILAKAINCTNKKISGDPCNTCPFCLAADNGSFTDLIEIDAASNRGIDEMKDLREKIVFSPNFGKAKIYIIDEVHMLTTPAFNALLKTLEEPPSHAYFILATTEFHKVPETIRSRCQTFFFQKISVPEITQRLKEVCDAENFSYDEEGLKIVAERANGGMRDALSILEQSASFGKISKANLFQTLGIISPSLLNNFFAALQEKNGSAALEIIMAVQNEGRSMESFAKDFLGFLREEFFSALQEKKSHLPFLLEVISFFETARKDIRSSEIPTLPLEIAVAKTLLLGEEKNFSTGDVKKIPMKKEEPSTKPINTEKQRLSLEFFHKNWNDCVAPLPSSLRIFLQKATLESFENGILLINPESEFEKEQIAKHLEKIGEVLKDKTGQEIHLHFTGQKTVSADEFAEFFA